MYARNAINAYAQVGIQTGVMDASPQKLITMLYDGARTAIAQAKFHMAASDVPAKGNAITRAINIIDNGLSAALDHEQGGEISSSLEQLYEYMTRRLLLANLRNDPALLTEVDGLLENLASAWAEISNAPDAATQNLSLATER
ncbi:flagellar export chaperone FliS [Cupriavidus sp. CuC1]|uniref:flagellar export chaperone FliS n=1 Tax=Cupriavidus sp. CuC1 TaxID=3373131 RepID=UPI0037D71B09